MEPPYKEYASSFKGGARVRVLLGKISSQNSVYSASITGEFSVVCRARIQVDEQAFSCFCGL